MKIALSVLTLSPLFYVLSSSILAMQPDDATNKAKGVPVSRPALSLQPTQGDPDKTGASAQMPTRWDQGKIFEAIPFLSKHASACLSRARYFYGEKDLRSSEKETFTFSLTDFQRHRAEAILYRASGVYTRFLLDRFSRKIDDSSYRLSYELLEDASQDQECDQDIRDLAFFHMADVRVEIFTDEWVQTHLQKGGEPFKVIDDQRAYTILEETMRNKRLPSWVHDRAGQLMKDMRLTNRASKGDGKEGKVEQKADGQGKA